MIFFGNIQYTLENDDLWTAARAQPPVWTMLRFKCWINKTCFRCFGFIINFYITGVLGWNPLSTWKGFWRKKKQNNHLWPAGGAWNPAEGKRQTFPWWKFRWWNCWWTLTYGKLQGCSAAAFLLGTVSEGCSGSRRCCWESGVQV